MSEEPATGLAGGRLTVAERLARLLGVIPWVVDRGGAHVEEISTRFDYPRAQLLEDLTGVLFFVGVHPFTPDVLIEVDIVDEIVEIRYADWFSRPLRLTAQEATRLLAAGRGVLSMTAQTAAGGFDAGASGSGGSDDAVPSSAGGADDAGASGSGGSDDAGSDDAGRAGPLMRALAKLSLALGDGASGAAGHIDVSLGAAPAETLDAVRGASARRRRIEIEYYSLGRDALTRRAVDPGPVFSHDGEWYLSGWCHRAGAERVFRVDRIRSVSVTDVAAEVELPHSVPPSVGPPDAGSTVTLRLEPSAAWAADYYPTRQRSELSDGRVEATLEVANTPWLQRLLLQLGPSAEMVAHDQAIESDLRARAARRVLERYQR